MTRFKDWLPSIILMLVIFGFSALPGKTIESLGLGKESWHIDAHFALFLLLGASFYRATKNVIAAIVYTLIYAFFDEFHQMFTPYRSSSFFDIQVDTIGGIMGGIIAWRFYPTLSEKLKLLRRK